MADSSEANPHADGFCYGTCKDVRDVTEVETESKQWDMTDPELDRYKEQKYCSEETVDCSLSECKAKKEASLMERERVSEPVSAMERERTMRNLVDMQRKVEQRQQRDRERQLLRVQERLSIIQNRKAEEDLLGLKHTDRIKHLTQDLPLEDKNKQKTVVKERLEQLRRERSYVMQSKRDRNTTGFKELLGPVALQSRDTEDAED
ncbi:stress response protein NST1 [Neolamprologus brichardi]|uniref:stress response protein NST1 n=1 Tax=Neolamprologus brichardi TaxID=32507 RepID=UPI0003EBC4ED|nr:stress response protein NST1 [Neolamprologus brichardi]